MAIVRNSANTVRTGRIGENTWYLRDGEQIVRQRLNNSNYGEGASRTEKQQERRAKWGNLVNFFKVISQVEKKAYESKPKGVTDYNMFMSANINSTPIYLTKAQVEAGGSVPGAFVVSKGSLPAVALSQGFNSQSVKVPVFVTDLVSPYVESLETATMGEWSQSFIESNPDWQDGDALCFLFVSYKKDSEGVPRSAYVYREYVLDVNSTTPWADVMNGDVIVERRDQDGFAFEAEDMLGAFPTGGAFIHSRNNGGLQVSDASIFLLENSSIVTTIPTIDEFTTDAQRAAAINSYGVEGSVILDPGD